MINANVVFWTFVILLGFIGASRGWLREVILTFSMVFALFVLNFFDGAIRNFTTNQQLTQPYAWLVKALPFLIITIFGYLGPAIAGRTGRGPANSSGRFEEGLLSSLLGAFNGYIIFSTLAWFAWEAGIMRGPDYKVGTNTLFLQPSQPGGWDSFFFIANSAVTYFSGPTLVLVLIALVLFVLIVVI